MAGRLLGRMIPMAACGEFVESILLVLVITSVCPIFANEVDTLSVHEMDEVVVVSTPKEHAVLRQQPLSSSSLGPALLQQRDVNGIKDLTAHIPGLFIPNYGSRLTTSIYLRGVGSRIGTPSVGMYVDDIPMANMSSMDQDLSDADRIDVLRGPQGTLYGRNTMGGLIRVYTKNPMNYQGTDIMLGTATYNNYRARVTHYHRPADNFAFSAGVSYGHQGGFFRNQALDGQRVDRGDDLAARWRGIFVPSEKVRLDLSARYQWTKQGGYPYGAKQGDDAGMVAYNRPSSYQRHLFSAGLNAEHDLGRIMMTSTTSFQFLKDDMMMDQDFSREDLYTLQQKQKGETLGEEVAVKSKGDSRWQWTSGVNFQYQWLDTQAPVTFYQDGLNWLSRMTSDNISHYMPTISAGPMTMTFCAGDLLQAAQGTPSGTGAGFPTHFTTPNMTVGIFHQSTMKELFGIGGLSLTGGLRLDYERDHIDYKASYALQHTYQLNGQLTAGMMKRTIDMVPTSTFGIDERIKGSLSDCHFHLMPRASLQYQWENGNLIYATASRGYRNGGYNIQMFNELLQADMRHAIQKDIAGATLPIMQAQPSIPADKKQQISELLSRMAQGVELDVASAISYEPETAWNYEIGSHLNLFEGRLKADLAAYWIETRNLQLSQMSESGMGRVTVNADRSRSIGAETSLTLTPVERFSISASYGYTHATLLHSGNEEHTSDYRVPFAPRHTASLGALQTWRTNGWLRHIKLYAEYKGAGRIYWTRENDLSQPFYGMLNARISVTHDEHELSLWGNNLTCTRYDAFCFVTRGQVYSQRGIPIQFGIDLRLKL